MNFSNPAFLKKILAVFIFLLLVTSPEILSRSAHPSYIESLSQKEENQLFSLLLSKNKLGFDELMNDYSWFNGNIMLIKNHRVIYQHCQGYANFRTRELLTPESAFELASVSKQFTAVAILQLYERGQLDIDDKVNNYIPELTFDEVTIRHLLNHTSGLPNYMQIVEDSWEKPYYPDNEDMIALLVDEKATLLFRAGTTHSYSNTGYAILASVVERVTKQSFTRFLHENIFEPLEMYNTFTSAELIDSTIQVKHIALGHRMIRRGLLSITPSVHNRILGDKGIHSTLEDLYKWDQALYSDKILSQETLKQAYEPTMLNKKSNVPYGFGFRTGDVEGERYVFHHGLWEGFRNAFVRYINRGDAVIILNNANQRGYNYVLDKFRKIIEEDDSQLTPVQQIAFDIATEGRSAAEFISNNNLVDKLSVNEKDVLEITRLLVEMDKPAIAGLIYEFFENNGLIKQSISNTVSVD